MAAGEGNDVSASITIQTRSRDAELDALAQKYDKLKSKLDETKNKGKEAADSLDNMGAVGSKALDALTSKMAGFISAGSLLAGVTKLLSDYEQRRKEAADFNLQNERAKGDAAQQGTPEDTKWIWAAADRLHGSGATITYDEAEKMAKQMSGAGFTSAKDEDFASRLTSVTGAETVAIIGGAKLLANNLGGVAKTGGLEDITSMAKAAADAVQGVNDVTFSQIESGLATYASRSGGKLGFDIKQLFAAESIVAEATGKPEEGARYLDQMFSKWKLAGYADDGNPMKGKSFAEMAKAYGEGKSESELTKDLGSEAARAFGSIQDAIKSGAYQQRLAVVSAAPGQHLADEMTDRALSNPDVMAARTKRAMENRSKIAAVAEGNRELFQEAFEKYRTEKYRLPGDGLLSSVSQTLAQAPYYLQRKAGADIIPSLERLDTYPDDFGKDPGTRRFARADDLLEKGQENLSGSERSELGTLMRELLGLGRQIAQNTGISASKRPGPPVSAGGDPVQGMAN